MATTTPPLVSGNDILDQFGKLTSPIKKLTGLQTVGYNLAIIIIILIALILFALGIQWWTHTANSPTLLAIDVNNADKIIAANNATLQQYKTINDIAREGPLAVLDTIVVKMLFPLLTGVIGYIFGAKNTANEGNADG